MSARMTLPPWMTSCAPIARPMPDAPPVIRAVLPAKASSRLLMSGEPWTGDPWTGDWSRDRHRHLVEDRGGEGDVVAVAEHDPQGVLARGEIRDRDGGVGGVDDARLFGDGLPGSRGVPVHEHMEMSGLPARVAVGLGQGDTFDLHGEH